MTALATLTTANSASGVTGDYYWPDYYWPWQLTSPCVNLPMNTIYYHNTVSLDRGVKAFELAQHLIEKKLSQVTSAKQFIELMNAILEKL